MFRRPATSLGQSRKARSGPCHSLKWCTCCCCLQLGSLMVHDMQRRGLKGSKRKIGRRLVDHLAVIFPFTFIYIHLHHLTFASFKINVQTYKTRYNKINLSVMEVLIHCDPSPQWNSSMPTQKGKNCMAGAWAGPQPHMEPGSGTPRKGATMGVFGPALESNSCGNHGDQLGLTKRSWNNQTQHIATWLWTF